MLHVPPTNLMGWFFAGGSKCTQGDMGTLSLSRLDGLVEWRSHRMGEGGNTATLERIDFVNATDQASVAAWVA